MRWKCGCAYDGADYAGWQTQNELESVQEVITRELSGIFKKDVRIAGSGRTDAGVHALEQVFHFDFDWSHGSQSLVDAMRSRFPPSIVPLYAEPVDAAFHARFSAVSKRYEYRIYLGDPSPFAGRYSWPVEGELDLTRMAEAVSRLPGERDFAAFAANRGVDYKSTVRNLLRAEIRQEGSYLYLTFEADGFMYKMVRSLVGTLVNVAFGRLSLIEFDVLLETAERTPMVFVAPAAGLFLKKVLY